MYMYSTNTLLYKYIYIYVFFETDKLTCTYILVEWRANQSQHACTCDCGHLALKDLGSVEISPREKKRGGERITPPLVKRFDRERRTNNNL